MGKQKNFLIGKKFGRLTVISQLPAKSDYKIRWHCICDCGGKKDTIGKSLLNGDTQSCGCLHKETMSKVKTTHGMRHTSEYNIWSSMFLRCENRKNAGFKNYGGRGITVCERWRTFENFFADMGPRPSKKHSIDRIDNDRGYSPENCRWTTQDVQARNSRKAIIVEIEDFATSITDLVATLGQDRSYIYHLARRRGISTADAVRLIVAQRVSDAYHGLAPRRSNRGWL